MKTSETLGQFAEAMAKVQAELKPAQMNAKNPFLKNKYADLADVVEACQKLSASHGLATVQMPFSCNDGVGITTRIIHTSGEWVEGEVIFPLFEEKGISMAQAAGKLITYARRYALASAFGVVADEDADGNDTRVEQKAAPQNKATAETSPAQQPKQAAPLSQTVTVGLVLADLESDGIADSGKALAIIRAKWEPLVKAQFGAEKLVKRETAQAMYDHVKDVVSQQAPTPPPAPEQGTAGDVDGVQVAIGYEALTRTAAPNIIAVVNALEVDNVTTHENAIALIKTHYPKIQPDQAVAVQIAVAMYEKVVSLV